MPSNPPWRTHAVLVARVAALTGLVASFFLVANYFLPPSAGGCPADGGCHTVRTCWVGGIFPGLWPVVGTFGFLTLFSLSLSSRPRAWRVLRGLSVVGALVGGGLLVAQQQICGAFCVYCLVTDTMALLTALAVWAVPTPAPETTPRTRWSLAGLAGVLLAGVGLWFGLRSTAPIAPVRLAQLPALAAAQQRPGVVTVIEYMDFTCEHCRAQHPVLLEALANQGERVRLIRHALPTASDEAESSARAYRCAQLQGQGEPMADLLVQASDLSTAGCEGLATKLGLDLGAWRACVKSPETDAHLQASRAAAREIRLVLKPTLLVGQDRFDGFVPLETLRTSLDAALHAPAVADSPRP